MKFDLDFLPQEKWMNAAGTAGFYPGRNFVTHFPDVGLFVTNPISYFPRTPAHLRCVLPFPGGFLVHSGYPNPGIKKIIQKFRIMWENSLLPICVNLLSENPRDLEKIIRLVEPIDNVTAIELGIDHSASKEEILKIIESASGELPIILSLPHELIFQDWLVQILTHEIVGISIQPPRGTKVHNNQFICGRLYGESVLPLTMHAVSHLQALDKPIFAGVGVTKKENLKDLIDCGLQNFQAHELIWRNNI
ncbi:MAG: hypothetical protein Q7U53_05270 [Anaerolineaceae bacterium]|nr:hypothetical protein [Anaerolineaceae bacterium]